jgi:hypothetical protein
MRRVGSVTSRNPLRDRCSIETIAVRSEGRGLLDVRRAEGEGDARRVLLLGPHPICVHREDRVDTYIPLPLAGEGKLLAMKPAQV